MLSQGFSFCTEVESMEGLSWVSQFALDEFFFMKWAPHFVQMHFWNPLDNDILL